ncbi:MULTISPECIES: methyl-accepting chemotaxis protein [Paraburkholderia]|uniref:Methyl-accepting chemotaxis protein n=1 Tax=Paraburkholderia madseniana TaxID=2599607 RepID=A0AAP5BI23_9BURK|nr:MULTISPECIES: methyl-accepting chemotaxis protein [Paraburkholderia]MCX4148928.1 methyl-accepting chemotaxis protein [Paraburkholderia madseniana]MDN7151865.1 methyl-accepting chemotaxis protein [Paraburkholderia sp. WS6]MDQ6410745.1 methyl-accepting chemotaxis protein [Paraburkholderia madseniana]
MNIGNMKLGAKLISAFILVSVISAIVSVIGVRSMGQISANADTTYRMDLVGLNQIQQANADVLRVGTYLRNAILASTAEQRTASLAQAEKALASAREHLNQAEPLVYTDKGKATFADLDQGWHDYIQAFDEMKGRINAAGLQDQAALTAYLLGEYHEKGFKTLVLMGTLVNVKQSDAQATAGSNDKVYEEGRNLMLVLVVLSVLIGWGIGVWMARSLTRQLGTEPATAANLARSVAAGDLSVSIDLRPGDTNSLMASLKAMREALSQVVAEVRENAEGVATASAQIAQGNLDLSSRTEEQAASLEETASSIEELTAAVRHNTDNAKQAATLAGTASGIAQQGGEVVGQVVETMREISASSTKMSEIISVIEGIAFQTNILALNAAVEAARAGEQGRGFAVVAGEVRALAQRSASAAKEIKDLIADSVNRVEVGSTLVEQAGGTINEIVASVKRVTDIVGEISSASQEQSTGIEQVNQAVNQMDQVTQQNAALVEEASAAAQSMAQQAQGLRAAVAFFKIDVRRVSVSPANTPRKEPHRTPPKSHASSPAKLTKPTATPRLTSGGSTAVATSASETADWQTF